MEGRGHDKVKGGRRGKGGRRRGKRLREGRRTPETMRDLFAGCGQRQSAYSSSPKMLKHFRGGCALPKGTGTGGLRSQTLCFARRRGTLCRVTVPDDRRISRASTKPTFGATWYDRARTAALAACFFRFANELGSLREVLFAQRRPRGRLKLRGFPLDRRSLSSRFGSFAPGTGSGICNISSLGSELGN